jgi:hypothetical protein
MCDEMMQRRRRWPRLNHYFLMARLVRYHFEIITLERPPFADGHNHGPVLILLVPPPLHLIIQTSAPLFSNKAHRLHSI